MTHPELLACTPKPLHQDGFNPTAQLPYDLTTAHIRSAMNDFLDFLGFINVQMHSRDLTRLEQLMMPANFSSLVGELMASTIPRYAPTLVRNTYHNGHPDLIPAGLYPDDAVQYSQEGIEIKASRYARRWQGHNPEAIWLMVFSFEANSASDIQRSTPPRSFAFAGVYGAKLELEDWTFSGRSATSRRTITASVNPAGLQKMRANWIYRASEQTQVDSALTPVQPTEG
jgi:hypothetical protein